MTDGWGEGAFFGVEDEDEERIMLLAPTDVRKQYLTIETPWGIRTKGGGGQSHAGSFTVRFMPLVDEDGIRLALHPLEKSYRPNQEIDVQLTLSATGSNTVAGYRPELKARWGTFDTPWRNRSCMRVPLGNELSQLDPGDKHELSFTLLAPMVAENYSLFVVFNLFKEESGDTLEIGSVYSESRLIRVRR